MYFEKNHHSLFLLMPMPTLALVPLSWHSQAGLNRLQSQQRSSARNKNPGKGKVLDQLVSSKLYTEPVITAGGAQLGDISWVLLCWQHAVRLGEGSDLGVELCDL